MFFSVIIPVYNVEKYLCECVESVLEQDEKDMEILLVDDGSTDGSGKICDEYREKYPETVRVIHKPNEGLLLTRRRGIRESSGRWLVHLDSDDTMLPGVLRDVRDAVCRYDPDLVIGRLEKGAKGGGSKAFGPAIPFHDGQVFEGDGKAVLYEQYFRTAPAFNSLSQKIARRDIVDVDADYSLLKGISMGEDRLQSLALLTGSRKCVFLDRPFLYYRYNPGSVSLKQEASRAREHVASQLAVIKEERKYLARPDMPGGTASAAAAWGCRQVCRYVRDFCVAGWKRKALKALADGVRNDDGWKWAYRTADGRKLGPFARVCRLLIRCRQVCLLYLWCRTTWLRHTRG